MAISANNLTFALLAIAGPEALYPTLESFFG
jgi:hypothetical protein